MTFLVTLSLLGLTNIHCTWLRTLWICFGGTQATRTWNIFFNGAWFFKWLWIWHFFFNSFLALFSAWIDFSTSSSMRRFLLFWNYVWNWSVFFVPIFSRSSMSFSKDINQTHGVILRWRWWLIISKKILHLDRLLHRNSTLTSSFTCSWHRTAFTNDFINFIHCTLTSNSVGFSKFLLFS